MQVEEGKRVENYLNGKLKEKSTKCSKLEEEIVPLRKYLEKEKIHEDKIIKSSTLLDDILALVKKLIRKKKD